MRILVLLALAVTMTYAQGRMTHIVKCFRGTCTGFNVCRQVLNTTSGEVVPICLSYVNNLLIRHERGCSDGHPLWVLTGWGDYSQASCGQVFNSITCPSKYKCVTVVPSYAVCCPSFDKIGECPEPQPGNVGVCADQCQDDKQCPSDLKCCKNPCSAHTCQTPVHSVHCENTTCGVWLCLSTDPEGTGVCLCNT
ncbi:uncharacterized protein LOC112566380 isoform X5 [Pomacea canaliculata]|uniref:uncharacterized protein LOC112566380 isoform X5 n=1 Tax=Pomacea canaliculata TaxID=400727 RepID=UPI000D72C8C8|nr:uncharacterized protein LOC112566380 isoform X5 [Pomacea canaliculata]